MFHAQVWFPGTEPLSWALNTDTHPSPSRQISDGPLTASSMQTPTPGTSPEHATPPKQPLGSRWRRQEMKPGPSNPCLYPSEPERSAPAGGASSAADPPPGSAPGPGVLPNSGILGTDRFGRGRREKGLHTDNQDDAQTAHADTPLGRRGSAAAGSQRRYPGGGRERALRAEESRRVPPPSQGSPGAARPRPSHGGPALALSDWLRLGPSHFRFRVRGAWSPRQPSRPQR